MELQTHTPPARQGEKGGKERFPSVSSFALCHDSRADKNLGLVSLLLVCGPRELCEPVILLEITDSLHSPRCNSCEAETVPTHRIFILIQQRIQASV